MDTGQDQPRPALYRRRRHDPRNVRDPALSQQTLAFDLHQIHGKYLHYAANIALVSTCTLRVDKPFSPLILDHPPVPPTSQKASRTHHQGTNEGSSITRRTR